MRDRIIRMILSVVLVFVATGCTKHPISVDIVFEPTEESYEEFLEPIDEHREEFATEEVTNPAEETEIPEPSEPVVFETEPTAPTEDVSTVTEPEYPEDQLVSLGVFGLTAYCSCQKCCGEYAINRPVDAYGNEIVYGASGSMLTAGVSIAVDPRVIPYGTQVVINGHTYVAHDTGGSIKGNRIDVYFDDHQDAWNFGTQYAEVFVYV